MTLAIKQSAAIELWIQLVKSSDHVTEQTGIAFGSATAYRVAGDGSKGAITTTGTGTPGTTLGYWREIDSTNFPGLYGLTIDSTITGVLGPLQIRVSAAATDPTRVQSQVFTGTQTDIYARTDVAVSTRAVGVTGTNAITWTVTNATTLAVVAGAIITIRTGSQSGPISVTTAPTDSTGVVVQGLNNGTYYWACDLQGSYQSSTGTLVVTGAATQAVALTPLPYPSAGSSTQCTVTGTVKTGLGTNYTSRTITTALNVDCLVNGVSVGSDNQTITVNSDGTWQANFYRQASCTHDSATPIAVGGIGYFLLLPDGIQRRVIIPNATTASYSSLAKF